MALLDRFVEDEVKKKRERRELKTKELTEKKLKDDKLTEQELNELELKKKELIEQEEQEKKLREQDKKLREKAENYRIMFWEDYKAQKEAAQGCTTYKGFFTHQNILALSQGLKNRDIAFRLGFTLGFTELSVNSFTGMFHVDYDKKEDSMFQDAIYEFIVNYLYLNPNETDFRFYRRLREVLKLSSLPLEEYGCPRACSKALKESLEREKAEEISKNKIGKKYKDLFMEWKSKHCKAVKCDCDKDVKHDCEQLLKEIKNDSELDADKYKYIVCLEEIHDYFEKVEKVKEIEEMIKKFEEREINHYANKIKKEYKKSKSGDTKAENNESKIETNDTERNKEEIQKEGENNESKMETSDIESNKEEIQKEGENNESKMETSDIESNKEEIQKEGENNESKMETSDIESNKEEIQKEAENNESKMETSDIESNKELILRTAEDNEESTEEDIDDMPMYPNEKPPLLDCLVLKAVKIYSTIKGYLMENTDDALMIHYGNKLIKVFTDEFLSCFFLVDRNLNPKTKCSFQKEKRLFCNQRLIDTINVIDKARMRHGDIFHRVRDNNIMLCKRHPKCHWLRTFKVLCNWRTDWSPEKFALVLDRFFLHKDFIKLANFRDEIEEEKDKNKKVELYFERDVIEIDGPDLNDIF